MTSVALMKDPSLLVCAANGSLYILNKSDGKVLMKDGMLFNFYCHFIFFNHSND